MSAPDNSDGFVNKTTRRRFLLGGAAGAAVLATGCEGVFGPPDTQDTYVLPKTGEEMYSRALRADLNTLTDMMAGGKALDKEKAKIVLVSAMREYDSATPYMQQQFKRQGLLCVREFQGRNGPEYVATNIDFDRKALVAVKGITRCVVPDFNTLDLTKAKRGGAVSIEDRAIAAPAIDLKGKRISMQQEEAYLRIAMKLRDNNIHHLLDTIRHTIATTGDINNLKPNHLAALNEAPEVMKHLEVGKDLFPGLIPPCPLIQVFRDERMHVKIAYTQDGGIAANTYNPQTDEWKWAGKVGAREQDRRR